MLLVTWSVSFRSLSKRVITLTLSLQARDSRSALRMAGKQASPVLLCVAELWSRWAQGAGVRARRWEACNERPLPLSLGQLGDEPRRWPLLLRWQVPHHVGRVGERPEPQRPLLVLLQSRWPRELPQVSPQIICTISIVECATILPIAQ